MDGGGVGAETSIRNSDLAGVQKAGQREGTGWRAWSLSKLRPNISGKECREGASIIPLAFRRTM